MVVYSGQPHSAYGLSLPELLVSMAVLTLLFSFTIPSMKSMVSDRRVSATTSELYRSLVLARSESIKRRSVVSVCSTVDGERCDEANSGWQAGWFVFSDLNGDGVRNNSEDLIWVSPSQSSEMTIQWNRGYSISFNSRGQTTTAGSFVLCDAAAIRAVVVSLTGRPRVEERSSCA